jgi:hypothetical protein
LSKRVDEFLPDERVLNRFNYPDNLDNIYGNTILLYTGLIPSVNPLSDNSYPDGSIYQSGGINILEKVDKEVLTPVEDSSF